MVQLFESLVPQLFSCLAKSTFGNYIVGKFFVVQYFEEIIQLCLQRRS